MSIRSLMHTATTQTAKTMVMLDLSLEEGSLTMYSFITESRTSLRKNPRSPFEAVDRFTHRWKRMLDQEKGEVFGYSINVI